MEWSHEYFVGHPRVIWCAKYGVKSLYLGALQTFRNIYIAFYKEFKKLDGKFKSKNGLRIPWRFLCHLSTANSFLMIPSWHSISREGVNPAFTIQSLNGLGLTHENRFSLFFAQLNLRNQSRVGSKSLFNSFQNAIATVSFKNWWMINPHDKNQKNDQEAKYGIGIAKKLPFVSL